MAFTRLLQSRRFPAFLFCRCHLAAVATCSLQLSAPRGGTAMESNAMERDAMVPMAGLTMGGWTAQPPTNNNNNSARPPTMKPPRTDSPTITATTSTIVQRQYGVHSAAVSQGIVGTRVVTRCLRDAHEDYLTLRCLYFGSSRYAFFRASRRKGSARTSLPPWIAMSMTQGLPESTASSTTSAMSW